MEQPVNQTEHTAQDAPAATKDGKFSALPARIGSALVLVAIAGTCFHHGGAFWLGFMVFCATVMLYEWFGLTKNFSPLWKISGIAYVAAPSISLYALTHLSTVIHQGFYAPPLANPIIFNGSLAIVYLIAMVAVTDIGAYFSGKLIGGVKLAPRISPNKTWAGLIGGSICAAAVSYHVHTELMGSAFAVFFGVLIAITGQTGDIFESWLKRRAGVKDSGKILPGHGGLLDRFDGLTLTAPLYLLTLIGCYGLRVL